MNQNFFNFPTSWVAEMNKQAQPKQVAAILQPLVDATSLASKIPDEWKGPMPPQMWTEPEQAPTPAKPKRKYTKRAK